MKNRAIPALLLGAALASAGFSAQAKTTRGPFVFTCVGDDRPAALTVTFLGAKADRARLSFNGKTVVARHALSADGALYTGRNVEFWNKGDDGVLEWDGEKSKCALGSAAPTS
jgi:membrane-bound inhibitor of C-type lysozyme